MARITHVEVLLVDLVPKVKRTDAIQSFVSQETPMVKITDAGLEAHFRTFDPAYPPQPVSLKAGGAARLLLIKISRSFEATRTDYARVTPSDAAPVPATSEPAPAK
jgi:hypothetical protein